MNHKKSNVFCHIWGIGADHHHMSVPIVWMCLISIKDT